MAITASDSAPATPSARLAVGALAAVGVGIVGLGARFLLRPDAAARGFGVPAPADDPFLAVKGVRDIGSGLLLGTVLALGDRRVAGWAGLAAAAIPLGDTAVVLRHGGGPATAFGVHGATAAVMAAAGLALVRDGRDRRVP